ncbi:MAG: hypothetical protein HY608_05100 [Planctomycetes bacterium]|nr:hypothetical protein [Planctomycetota bacterium]
MRGVRRPAPALSAVEGSCILLAAVVAASAAHGDGADPRAEVVVALAGLSGDPEANAASLLDILERDPGHPLADLVVSGLAREAKEPLTPALTGRIRAALDRFCAQGGAEAFAVLSARLLLTQMLVAAGDWPAARGSAALVPSLQGGRVIGPFGSLDSLAFYRAHPPEAETDLGAAYPGTLRYLPDADPCRWVSPAPSPYAPTIRIGGACPALPGGVYYALVQVRSPMVQQALLTVAGGRTAVRVNGVDLASVDPVLRRTGTVRIPFQLEAGWNRILVKFQSVRLLTLLTDLDGRPLDALRYETGVEMHPLPGAASPRLGASARDGLFRARAAVAGAPDDGWALAVAGLQEAVDGTAPEAASFLEKAVGCLPSEPALRILLARQWPQSPHLPSQEARVHSRSAYEEALRLSPDAHAARLALAGMLAEDGRHREAIDALDEMLRRSPDHPGALRLRLRIAAGQEGWQAQAIEDARHLARVLPSDPAARSVLRSDAERHGDLAAVEADLRAHCASSIEDLSLLYGHLRRHRREEDALALLDSLRESDPGDPDWEVERATLLDALGRTEEACVCLSAALGANPCLPHLHARASDLFLRWGDKERASAAARRALTLDPSQLELRRRLRYRQGDLDRFWEPYGADAPSLLASAPNRGSFPDAPTLALLDETVDRLERDGAMTRITHRLVQVLDDRGRSLLQDLPIEGEPLVVRTHLPGGRFLEPVRIASEGSYTMPGLEPGAAIEYLFREDKAGSWNGAFQAGLFYFQDFNFTEPLLLSRYVLLRPAEIPSPVTAVHLEQLGDALSYREEPRDGWIAQIWEVRNQKRPKREANLPPVDEFLPHLIIGTVRTWEEILTGEAEGHLRGAHPSPIVADWAAGVIGDTPPGSVEQAASLYRAMAERIQDGSVGEATHILLSGQGERLVLLKAALEGRGIPCDWVFARQRPEDSEAGHLPPFPAPGHYRVALLRLRGEGGRPDTWIDGRWRALPFGQVASDVAGMDAFVVTPQGAVPVRVPPGRFEDVLSSQVVDLRLQPDGRGAGSLTWSEPGAAGAGIKEQMFQAEQSQRRRWFDQYLNGWFPGASATGAEPSLPGIGDWGAPWQAHLDFGIALFAAQSAPGVRECALLLRNCDLVKTYGAQPDRDYPLVVGEIRREDRVALRLPASWRPEGDLPTTTLATRFGVVHLNAAWDAETNTLMIRRLVDIPAQRVAPGDFLEFLRFARAVDVAETARIRLFVP